MVNESGIMSVIFYDNRADPFTSDFSGRFFKPLKFFSLEIR